MCCLPRFLTVHEVTPLEFHFGHYTLADHVLFPFFLSQNNELLENGAQFLLTAISQVFRTLCGPGAMGTMKSLTL